MMLVLDTGIVGGLPVLPELARLGATNLKNMLIQIVRPFLNWWYRKHPPEMVGWWKTKMKVRAKRIRRVDGNYEMIIEGEKYPQPNYPRGHILFGPMSKLKHEIKNQIFNASWWALDTQVPQHLLIESLKYSTLPAIFALMEESRFDMLPFRSLSPVLKELSRGFTEVARRLPEERADRARKLRDLICFILQEDDAYRFRFQWVAGFMNPHSLWRKLTGRTWTKDFELALSLLEHAEVVGDMKERQRLFKRVLLAILEDPETHESFDMLVHELDWSKLKLSKGDKYYFRGKYFKVDYPYYSY